MDHYRSRQRFDPEAEIYIERLSSYALVVERSSEQLRKTRTPEQIRVAYNSARAEWDADFPGPVVPLVGTPEWTEMWNKLKPVLTSTPETDKDLALTCIAGAFAMTALTDHELADHELQIAIKNEAERRTMLIMPPEDEVSGTAPETSFPTYLPVKQSKYVDLIGCDIPDLDFIITDYGTSYSKGPWVEYLSRNGTKGKDEVIVPADEMDEMLEKILGPQLFVTYNDLS